MSFWDKYLAPGDVRGQPKINPESLPKPPPEPPRLDEAHRARRKNGLFFGGIAFTLLSFVVTRRTLVRKRITMQKFDQSNAPPIGKVDGSLEAAEALGLATLNVFAMAMLGIGGALKYYDIASVPELRTKIRAAAGMDSDGNQEADSEIEAWIADVLSRKDSAGNLRDGVQQKMLELAQKEVDKKMQEKRQSSRDP